MTTAPARAAHAAGNAGKRIARSCVLTLLIAAVVLSALAPVFHVPPANAQETSEVVWDTKLKVWAPRPPANTWPRVVGWTSNFAGGDWLGTVSSSTFTFEDNDYEVVQLLVDRDTSTLSLVFEAAKDGREGGPGPAAAPLNQGDCRAYLRSGRRHHDLGRTLETRCVYPSGLVRRLRHRSRLGARRFDHGEDGEHRRRGRRGCVHTKQPGDGPACHHWTRPGGRDPDCGHVGHCRRRRAGHRHLQISVDTERRRPDRRHRGRDQLHVHAD